MDLACIYIPHFAAWALSQRWQNDATASGPDAGPDGGIAACAQGHVLACTPELRHLIQVGDPVDRARRLAPQAQFLLRDPAVEQALWDHVLFRLYDLTPQVQPVPDPLSNSLRSSAGQKVRPSRPSGSGSLYQSPAPYQ